MNNQEQLAWAKKELCTIMMDSSKTRYKELLTTPEILANLEAAFLAISIGKKESYKNAHAGVFLTSFNWINENPVAAKNTLLLQKNMVAISDIPMLPTI